MAWSNPLYNFLFSQGKQENRIQGFEEFYKVLITHPPKKGHTTPAIFLREGLVFENLETGHKNQLYRADTGIIPKSGQQTAITTYDIFIGI